MITEEIAELATNLKDKCKDNDVRFFIYLDDKDGLYYMSEPDNEYIIQVLMSYMFDYPKTKKAIEEALLRYNHLLEHPI